MNRIGILGGGQLAMMLAEAASKHTQHRIIFCKNKNDPATKFATEVIIGDLNDKEALENFFNRCDTVIFENEFVNCDLLEECSQKKSIQFQPSLSVIRALQNKLSQKKSLVALDLPTAIFQPINTPTALHNALEKFNHTCVLKWSQFGYDGKGVLVVKNNSSASLEEINKFYLHAQNQNSDLYAEAKIDFKNELALVTVRAANGDFVFYPLVISSQENGICKWVHGPASRFLDAQNLELQAQAAAQKIGDHFKFVGAFAIEFFLTQENELVINEIAPRVHNSGHFSLQGCSASQFENHVLACLGKNLIPITTTPYFTMLNILGPENISLQNDEIIIPFFGQDFFHYWYDKTEMKAGRKMGHVNFTAQEKNEHALKLKKLQSCHEGWIQQLKENYEKK